MEFLVTTTNSVMFNNNDLQKATNTVLKLGDAIKKNWFAIAYIVAHVDETRDTEPNRKRKQFRFGTRTVTNTQSPYTF